MGIENVATGKFRSYWPSETNNLFEMENYGSLGLNFGESQERMRIL